MSSWVVHPLEHELRATSLGHFVAGLGTWITQYNITSTRFVRVELHSRKVGFRNSRVVFSF
jgi:hypothetical protein